MSKIFLTSFGIKNSEIEREFLRLIGDNPQNLKACIITTASVEYKEKDSLAINTKNKFEDLSFKNVDYIDLEFEEANKLEEYDVVFLNGGNPFFLLYHMKKSGADKIIKKMAAREKVIVGASAGSMVLGDTIGYVTELNKIVNFEDMNFMGMKDFSGLGFSEFKIFPHYERMSERVEDLNAQLRRLEQETGWDLKRLSDNEAILLEDDHIKYISSPSHQ